MTVYVAQRGMTVAGKRYQPGDVVPAAVLPRRSLAASLNLGRLKIEQRPDAPAPKAKSAPAPAPTPTPRPAPRRAPRTAAPAPAAG